MKKETIYLLIFMLMLFLKLTPGVLAQEQNKEEIGQVKEQVLDLQAQMDKMQKTYKNEINILKREIRKGQGANFSAAGTDKEVESLRKIAELEAAKQEQEESEETVFKQRGLALQELNPEISVTGDMISLWQDNDAQRQRFDFNFRNLGLHFEAYLDPYTRFKAAVPVTETSASLGEAYFTRYGILRDVNLTLGKFRQQFGVVNRWHKHGLDQVDFPLALRQVFGSGGLNQSGVSLDWNLPALGNASQEITLQLTNGENDRLFSGNIENIPCFLSHYKNYRDISKDTYLEFGISGLMGRNDTWTTSSDNEYKDLSTFVFGADMTLLWEPTEKMRYRNIVWRSEMYLLNRDILAPDGSGKDNLAAWGAYSYLQSKVSRTVEIGIRGDFYKPDTKDYADVSGLSLSPLAVTSDNASQWQIGPYLTWHQSPFVKCRLEYNHLEDKEIEADEDVLMIQVIFAAGPHKHERY